MLGLPEQPLAPPMYGPRQMLPPSPQLFQPRFSQPSPLPQQQPANARADVRGLPSLHNRPGSSMSISSMLGSDTEKFHDQAQPPLQQFPSSYRANTTSTPSVGGAMSPPQHTSRASIGEYSYKPRSQTPDRAGFPDFLGTRQQRSSSGTMMQRPGPFEDTEYRAPNGIQMQRFGESLQTPFGRDVGNGGRGSSDQVRRTSISGALQRPSSQPHPHDTMAVADSSPTSRETQRAAWAETANDTSRTGSSAMNMDIWARRPSFGGVRQDPTNNIGRDDGLSGSYDTRPPIFGPPQRPSIFGLQDRDAHPPLSSRDKPQFRPPSPNALRQVSHPSPDQTSGSIIHRQANLDNAFHQSDALQVASQSMTQQESSQSQPERSIFGERIDKSRRKLFSPFGSSVAGQPFSLSAPPEEQGRKASDDLSQHRAILNLAAEGKRGGRFSPLPQAVQGAQAQSVGPDAAIKTEHGRVFSGIGSGINNLASIPSVAPPGLSASPFKRDEAAARNFNNDTTMKLSRSAPGASNRRTRKPKEEGGRAAIEAMSGKRTMIAGRGAKRARSNHHHQYKIENDNIVSGSHPRRHGTLLSGLNPARPPSIPDIGDRSIGLQHHHLHHHHHRHHALATTHAPAFQPCTTIQIAHILQRAGHHPRRHLGFFLYAPHISVPDLHTPLRTKLGVSIRPNLLPSFKDPDMVNCTYTIRVSRSWLRSVEREAICAERSLWGAGIYTDDSDPVAAAIHSGYVKGAWNDWVDISLLEQIIREQNPRIDGGQEHVPEEPVEPRGDLDLHITMLVLPQLEKYEEIVRYGLKSRTWPEEAKDAPHDGVSFMVLHCEWVDEGTGRGKERTGVARRKRLHADYQNLRWEVSSR